MKERKDKRPMNKAKRNYKSKCKSRIIDFYLHEQDLYNFSKEINFNKFVKDMLKVAKQMGKDAIIKWKKEGQKNG